MNQLVILLFTLLIFNQELSAQENNCGVAVDALKGTYTGDCAKGKANGHGKSSGKDIYDGNFKNGYPDGKGTYTWQNGNYYEGDLKKGKLEGEGTMHYKSAAGPDSVVKGFWKNDKYIGQFEKAFVVKTFTGRISKVDCRLISKKGNNIVLTTRQLAGTGGGLSANSTVSISNIAVTVGTYYMKYDQLLPNGAVTRMQDVLFPFRAIFYLTNGDQTEIIFNQAGEYDVTIDFL